MKSPRLLVCMMLFMFTAVSVGRAEEVLMTRMPGPIQTNPGPIYIDGSEVREADESEVSDSENGGWGFRFGFSMGGGC